MVIDMSIPRDRVRLAVGDTQDIVILGDSVYDYLLDTQGYSEPVATQKAAYYILGQLAPNTRQRLDRIEVYGNQAFEQYVALIKMVIKDPSAGINIGAVWGGGVSIEDFVASANDPDVILKPIPTYDDYNSYEYILGVEKF